MNLPDGTQLVVGRQLAKVKSNQNWIRIPEYKVRGNKVIISHLWVGSINMPRRPFWSFRELWEKHLGRKDAINVWSRIRSYNTQVLLKILELLEKEPETQAKKLVKRATMHQLRNIAESFEEL
ncbi:hypothetical protein [Aquifex aeolicus]|uniref:Uncharacterized protein aq_1084 n=1 Tax=Aquifex aeolicus (strain VF5) TaxID=224324 RepID=Y1084_AQUAE|nr:hypothetical protein [Aquifex aeolicus]O67176.1 RecName: Full=Uncharacterized protein aq_1084 [Aquifex aeolicus VF5]AAC07139.1 putative protein [Aquifex aeolicus VF5]